MSSFEELWQETLMVIEPLSKQAAVPATCRPEERASTSGETDLLKTFLDDFAVADADSHSGSAYRSLEVGELAAASGAARGVGERVAAAAQSVAALRDRYEAVERRTNSLHDACDTLMAEQTRLAGAAEDVRSRLTYFSHVDHMLQKLASPHLLVTGQAFTRMLTTIDECMEFLKQNSEYKEADIYYAKYQQCLSRALSVVKSFVVENLSRATTDIQLKLKTDSTGEDTFALFYGQFASHAQTVRSLMETLEPKFQRSVEYQSLLSDCYHAYFQQRDALLRPSVGGTIRDLIKKHSRSTCTMVRASCSFLLRLCEDEYRLFYQFFTRATDTLHDFTQSLCMVFYDEVRPLVIHIPHLETLGELCAILKVEMLDERCAVESDVYDGFVRVLIDLAGDVGERLVYRAQLYGQSDILGYRPAPGDLAYPEKLQMMQNIALKDGVNKPADGATPSAVDMHGLWYPTVRRAVLCLAKLYKCIDNAVFQATAEEVLAMCLASLQTASDQIAANKKPLDAHLFFIKHMLILREQTSPFRVDVTSPPIKDTTVDFSKVKVLESASNFFRHKAKWFSIKSDNALLEFLIQVPAHVTEHVTDSRKVLDLRLRDECQRFIAHCVSAVCLEFIDLIDKVDALSGDGEDEKMQLIRQQPFASVESVSNLAAQAYRKLKDFVPNLRAALSLYIANRDTENILYTPIKKKYLENFDKFAAFVQRRFNEEERQIVAFPSADQLNVIILAN